MVPGSSRWNIVPAVSLDEIVIEPVIARSACDEAIQATRTNIGPCGMDCRAEAGSQGRDFGRK
jgi:hypothetical protein